MADFIFLMHRDAAPHGGEGWGVYLQRLEASGNFEGGSSIGGGECVNKAGRAVPIADHLVGFIKVRAESIEQARELLTGNPVYENGGTVEIRALPRE